MEINYKRIVIQRVWRLLPEVTIHALALHDRFCVTGSEDGILRVWPLDLSAIFMEAGERVCSYPLHCLFFVVAEHEGEVTALDISEDGLKILAGTSAVSYAVLVGVGISQSTCSLLFCAGQFGGPRCQH